MAPTPTGRRWRRKVLGVPLVGWLVLAFAGTALAVILLLLRGGFAGSVSGGEWDLELGGNATELFSDNVACVVSEQGGGFPVPGEVSGNVNVQWTGAFAGETCTITARYHDTGTVNTTAVRLCKFEAPASIGAVLNSAGATVAPGGFADVSVTLTYNGGSVSFSPDDHGFDFVRESEHTTENGCLAA